MAEKQNPSIPAQSGATQDFYPGPPPGPPPTQQQAQQQPHHSNDVPLPDERHPGWTHRTDSDIYDDKPTVPAAHNHAQATGEPHKGGWGDKLAALGRATAAPFNAVATKLGSETFFPTTMDKECEKAARILRSFCKDGIYTDADQAVPLTTGEVVKPKKNTKSLLTIPSKVITRAVGIAVFTTGRVGYGVSGSSGSGVLVARLPDGRWSPPSGVQIHSIGAGFTMGIDIYDCVIVINTPEALKAFTRTRMSLGSDLAIAAGPYGAGGSLEWAAPESTGKDKAKVQGTSPAATPNLGPTNTQSEPNPFAAPPPVGTQPAVSPGADPATGKSPKQPGALRKAIAAPVYSYVKSRGLYAGIQIDGTVVTERKDANAAFYGTRVAVDEILKGNVPAGSWQGFAGQLHATIKGAEGWRGSQQPDGTVPAAAVGQQHVMSPAGGAFPPASGTAAPGGHDPFTAQMAHLNVAGTGQVPVPVPGQGAPQTKAEEAAAEAAGVHRSDTRATMLPAYSTQEDSDLHRSNTRATMLPAYTAEDTAAAQGAVPPVYVDDGIVRPAVGDQKTGH